MTHQRKDNVRSIRVTPHQARFINTATEFELSTDVRRFIERERARYASGVCGVCGRIVYAGGHTVTTGGTPLGNAFNLDTDTELDLCETCEDDAITAVTDTTTSAPATEYKDRIGDSLYAAHRHVVIHISRDHHDPDNGINVDTLLTDHVTDENPITKTDILDAIQAWFGEYGDVTDSPCTLNDLAMAGE